MEPIERYDSNVVKKLIELLRLKKYGKARKIRQNLFKHGS